MSCAGCAGDSGKNLDSHTLDHDGVIMMDHDDVPAMSCILRAKFIMMMRLFKKSVFFV